MQKLQLTVTLACALAALALAAPAQAEIVVGAADNRPESSPEQAERFYDTMFDVGLTENRLTLVWNPQRPTEIERRAALDQAVELAAARGVQLTFSVYARPANAISSNPANGARFVAFMAQLARTYPSVKSFIVGNEPNKTLGWLPQFTRGRPVACSSYAGVLAAAYDALKAVDQSISVIGLALGARGNDNPAAPTNASISPVRCIRDIGRAYRASRRRRPLMDELSIHPYPNHMADSLDTGYRWPNAGIANLARIKQAVWDAFNGTAQPIFPEDPGAPFRTMKFRLNEVGWQTTIPPGSAGAYHGRENVAVTDDGHQAVVYSNLIPYLACDASVRSVLFFNMVDEPDLGRWQSGLLRADWTRRPSYNIVRTAILGGSTRCNGRPVVWRHATNVVKAQARFGDSQRRRRERETLWSFRLGAEEGANFAAAIFPATRRGAVSASERARFTRALRGRSIRGAVATVRGRVDAWGRVVQFRKQRLKPGYYVYAVRMTAEMNPVRSSTFVGRAFQVGTPRRTKKKPAPTR